LVTGAIVDVLTGLVAEVFTTSGFTAAGFTASDLTVVAFTG
jgi:hypothetical protein